MMIIVMLAMGVMLDDCHGGGDDSFPDPDCPSFADRGC